VVSSFTTKGAKRYLTLFWLSPKRPSYLTLFWLSPKRLSPYERRGTSQSDRVRSKTDWLCELCAFLCVLRGFFLFTTKGAKKELHETDSKPSEKFKYVLDEP
jgi:hypothetical protein